MQPHVVGAEYFLTVPTLLSVRRQITGAVFISLRIMSSCSVLFPETLLASPRIFPQNLGVPIFRLCWKVLR